MQCTRQFIKIYGDIDNFMRICMLGIWQNIKYYSHVMVRYNSGKYWCFNDIFEQIFWIHQGQTNLEENIIP